MFFITSFDLTYRHIPCYNTIILNFIKDVSKMKLLLTCLLTTVIIIWSFWNGALYASLCVHLNNNKEHIPFYCKWRKFLEGFTTSKKISLCIGFSLVTSMAFYSWCKYEHPFTLPKFKAFVVRNFKKFFAHFKGFSP